MTITLNASPDDLMLIIGTKEVQLYELSRKNDILTNDLIAANVSLSHAKQRWSEAAKDNDMAQMELNQLRSDLAKLTMKLERSV